jgi:hypothetical protein
MREFYLLFAVLGIISIGTFAVISGVGTVERHRQHPEAPQYEERLKQDKPQSLTYDRFTGDDAVVFPDVWGPLSAKMPLIKERFTGEALVFPSAAAPAEVPDALPTVTTRTVTVAPFTRDAEGVQKSACN